MFAFIVRRLLFLPVVIFVLTIFIVGLLQLLSPEQRAAAFIQNDNQARNLQLVIREHGLDKPFLVQYWNWLKAAAQGNLGFSKSSNLPVLDTIKQRFPSTLELALYSLIPLIGFGVWLGTLAGLNKNKFIDQFARVFAVVTGNIPTFVMGIILVVIFYGLLGIAPGPGQVSPENQIYMLTNPVPTRTGMLSIDALLAGNWVIFWDVIHHLILPVITLTTVLNANLIMVTRGSMIETLNQDFVRTARAKGLSERTVNIKHARRNALLPVATIAGFQVAALLGGAVITETIFAWPGIGSWGADAASRFDVPGILGFALLAGMVTVVMNLVVDILYAVIDPRVRFD